jgi:hypothetical protein
MSKGRPAWRAKVMALWVVFLSLPSEHLGDDEDLAHGVSLEYPFAQSDLGLGLERVTSSATSLTFTPALRAAGARSSCTSP